MTRLSSLRSALDRKGYREVAVREWRSSVVLEGSLPSWNDRVAAGFVAAGFKYKGVVNDLEVPGLARDRWSEPSLRDGALEGAHFDVVIIGGGIIGASIARELTRYDLSVALLEKQSDLAMHTSGRNDGMIHDGFGARPGTLKARYNVRGNRLWTEDARELGIELKRPGSLVLYPSPAAHLLRPLLSKRARANGVDGWEFWSREKVAREEPALFPEQHGALFLPSAGVVSPYKAVVAYAESAVLNGARVSLDTLVSGFDQEQEADRTRIARVRTNRGTCFARAVVNAAGNWADVVAGLADDRFFSLHPRRGTDAILDLSTGAFLKHIVSMPSFLQSRSRTKGGGLVKTVEGNVLVGPTARELPGREDYATTRGELEELNRHLRLNTRLSPSQIITYFAGVRPCTWEEDFIVERSQQVANLVHAAGIQSPGLASAPAIARDVAALCVDLLSESRQVRPNPRFEPRRQAPTSLGQLSLEERSSLIAAHPAYGRVVCRCEQVSEGELVDALHSPIPVSSLDSMKRRTRTGMGRCHGGFCTPRVMEIIARERGIPLEEVTKKGEGSRLLEGPEEPADPPATAPQGEEVFS